MHMQSQFGRSSQLMLGRLLRCGSARNNNGRRKVFRRSRFTFELRHFGVRQSSKRCLEKHPNKPWSEQIFIIILSVSFQAERIMQNETVYEYIMWLLYRLSFAPLTQRLRVSANVRFRCPDMRAIIFYYLLFYL